MDTGIDQLERARTALLDGLLVVIPTDTVYGLAASADDEPAVRRLYEVKQRDHAQPIAVVFASMSQLFETFPKLDVRTVWAIRSLMPGPWTLIVDNVEARWPWLTGGSSGPIGVRVPAGALDLPPVAATSANLSGRPTASRIDELDPELDAHVACTVERGELPAANESTVLDIVAWARGEGPVRVLRDTAGRAGQALAVLADGPNA